MQKLLSILLFLSLFGYAFSQQPQPTTQPPVQLVDTSSRPVEKQEKRTFEFAEDQVYFSNQFDGARLNNVRRDKENSYIVTILPENIPINPSPWYAFQVWSKKKKEITVTFHYPEDNQHRYSPQISTDGKKWKPLAQEYIKEIGKSDNSFGPRSRPQNIIMRLKIGKKRLWVSGQELQNSNRVFEWMDKLAKKKKFQIEEIGRSTEGRSLRMLKMGNLNSKNMIMVISRQHPPEVTGYFVMQAFIEKIADGSNLSKEFRRKWAIYVVPLMNPDGVDNGHWRHNAGGIDLNRDWYAFNQPETRAVRDFLKRRAVESGGKFYFGIDFHSTWEDIYYPMTKDFQGNMPNLVWNWLDAIKKTIPNYQPNIQPSNRLDPTQVSRNYFLKAHQMEAIVFEIGDNTSREFIKQKGEVGATELMKLILGKMVK